MLSLFPLILSWLKYFVLSLQVTKGWELLASATFMWFLFFSPSAPHKNIWFFYCCSGQHVWGLSLIVEVLQLYGQIQLLKWRATFTTALRRCSPFRSRGRYCDIEVIQRSKEHVLLQNVLHCEEKLGFWQWQHLWKQHFFHSSFSSKWAEVTLMLLFFT